MKNWSPAAGLNIAQYAPQTPFTQIITHANGLTSRVDTYSTGIGEMNVELSASGVHFDPTQRRYEEDIEKAIDGMNIVQETVTAKDEPKHFDHQNKGLNLEFMEHKTFVDLPTLDAIDKVRSRMTDVKTMIVPQHEYINLERIMTRRPMIYGSPSNAQALPGRFCKVRKGGERNPLTGEKEYEALTGVY
jgi:hypothetical protein